MTDSADQPIAAGPLSLLPAAIALCGRAGRDDLAVMLETSRARIERPDTVIAVVGEFKQGKSSLVNGLLGASVCPVDDDIATACLTVVRYGDAPSAVIHIREGRDERALEVPLDELAAYVVEHESPEFGAATAEARLPNPFLRNGIILVDTPGVGSLNPGYLAMTLAYIRSADALLFVTDASAPLNRPELEFLAQAKERCPVVLAVMPKIDLFPHWRTVLDISADALSRAGVSPPICVSSALRMAALKAGRADLNERSGYPGLLAALDEHVLRPAASSASLRAYDDIRRALSQLAVASQSELDALSDPAAGQARLEDLKRARERFEHLRGSGARWATVMNDGFADLIADVDHVFRATIRALSREVEERIEAGDPAKEWETFTAEVRARVANAAETMVTTLEQGAERVADEIVGLLREEELEVSGLTRGSIDPDVARLWLDKGLSAPSLASAAGTGYAGLRGAQSGILVFGMLANLAGIALSTMAVAGIGIVFGGKQLLEDRRRQVAARRQQARSTLRQFLDDVQFQISKDMRDLSRDLQRRVRDHFSTRISEVTRTYAETVDALQKSARQSEGEQEARRKELLALTGEIDRLLSAVPQGSRA